MQYHQNFMENNTDQLRLINFDESIGNQHWCEDEYKAFQEVDRSLGWKYEFSAFSFFAKKIELRV